ncbi:Hsp20/alpha crystallin family protein [Pseudoduganella sp. GCM10020061]|uniref:Hsp20/alpha crystallin family protein n=1 Tax=Pseudoduganella sp. GCM10020061 TaxID=3317345 RepID=UPI00363EE9F5
MANNMTPFDPFRDLMRVSPLHRMEEFLRDMRPLSMRDMPDMPAVRCDVNETDQAYTIRAEIPGVRKEDIKVDVNANRVTISAESQQRQEQKEGEKVVRCEIYRGEMYRSFTLEHEVDESKAEAKYQDGILELTLPKREQRTGQKLEIH